LFPLFATGINNTSKTGGKIAAGVVPVANLPQVLLIPVVHLDLRISPRIFEKICNGPTGILWGWGKLIHEQNQKQKIL
jgi:hypothetical protein